MNDQHIRTIDRVIRHRTSTSTSGNSADVTCTAGSNALTFTAAAVTRCSTSIAGDIRRSSVPALNVSPHTPIIRPAPQASAFVGQRVQHLLRRPVELLIVDPQHLTQEREVVAVILGDPRQRDLSFGKHEPPQPGPGFKNSLPIRWS